MCPDPMDAVFQALAHRVRRRILDIVRDRPGCNVNEVAEHFGISRIGVMKHLRVLEKADLVLSEKEGRDRRLYLNAMPIQRIHERWISEYGVFWAAAVSDIKQRAEAKSRKGKRK